MRPLFNNHALVQSKGRQTLIQLAVKQLKGATQDHPDGAWKLNGAELNQLKIAGNALLVEERSAFTKFDVENSPEVVGVKLWLDNGNGKLMAERHACRHALFLAMSWLYPPMG